MVSQQEQQQEQEQSHDQDETVLLNDIDGSGILDQSQQQQQKSLSRSMIKKKKRWAPRRAVEIYAEYAGRLWNETSLEARQRIARDKATTAMRDLQHVLREDEYYRQAHPEQVDTLLQACHDLLLLEEEDHDHHLALLMETDEEEDDGSEANGEDALAGMSPFSSRSMDESPIAPTVAQVALQEEAEQELLAAAQGLDVDLSLEAPVIRDNDPLVQQEQTEQHGEKDNVSSTAVIALPTTAETLATTPSSETAISNTNQDSTPSKTKKKRPRRSILFGALMGLAVALWVFSGNYIFTGLFTLMTILGQLEYYRMVINTGVYPARRISVVGACSMFLTALFCPQHHQLILPLAGLYAMIWFLTMKRSVTTIPEIATTFTGMFYLGYVPSFWVRLRLIGAGREPTRLAPILGPLLELIQRKAKSNLPPMVYPQAIHLPITTGAIFIFWTWLCLAFSDVGAYFVGKNMGRTPLGRLSPAAGATSPNKTVEGVLGGCAVSALLGMLGAWVQKWPFWVITGMIHGTLLGLIGLIGDLTASMIKRDAGIKDFGDLIPEHGGILDRVDSFVWSAPYSWLVCHTIIPALKTVFR